MKRVIFFILEALLFIIVVGLIALLGWAAYTNLQIENVESISSINAPGRHFDVDGYAVHVQTFGMATEQPAIVLLHGFDPTGGLSMMPLANELRDDNYVIVPDLLGFGFSERITQSGTHYTYEGQAARLKTLLDLLGVGQVNIIGHSYGGAVAAQFALDYPRQVEHIAFIAADIYPQSFNIGRILQELPVGIGRAFTFTFLGGGSADNSHLNQGCINCSVNPRNQYVLITDTTDSLIAVQQSIQDSQLADNVGSLSMPVAVIWGRNDAQIPVALGERLAEETQAVESVFIGGSGHYPQEDSLGDVMETLAFFWR